MAQYLLYRIGIWFSLNLPLGFAYWLASFVAMLQYMFCVKDRAAVVGNLSVILSTSDKAVLHKHAKGVFINFAKYLVDFFRFSVLNKKYIEKYIKIEGRENLFNAFKNKNGVIALTGHVGNWELSAVVTAYLGCSVNAVALSHKDRRVNDFFIRQRESKGIKVVPMGVAVKRCFIVLKNNELIGLLGDRDFSGSGVAVEFLGKSVSIPKGPAMISLKSGAPIVPTFSIRQIDNTYKTIYLPPIYPVKTGNKEQDFLSLTKKCVSVIEDKIREYPEQWFMFREFWAEDANKVDIV